MPVFEVEYKQTTPNRHYEARGWSAHVEEDDFNEGCNGKSLFKSGTDRFTGKTVQDIVLEMMRFVGTSDNDAVELNSCDELGRVDISVQEDDDATIPSLSQIEDWKLGKCRLWYCTYTFNVRLMTEETVELHWEDNAENVAIKTNRAI